MQVMIILGSKSDTPVSEKAESILDELGVEYEIFIASAHRTPDRVKELVEASDAKVFLAIAGMSAALPGVVASHTLKPVIGVPVSGKLNMDAMLSILQMPPGIPVGTVGLDNGKNAALLACEILALTDKELEGKLREYRKRMQEKVLSDSESLASK
ncbi:MAG: 5-(carboxyamino)imidazole ribonucleotide mutase [Thermoplasmata archaeon]|nr:MAG: 5-(carboxyamino)imidazole ribonucleotide mutase [Thermoplasmata archaeon]